MATDYDEVPYQGHAYWFTHPDHLGLLGALQGLDTARAARARVLELGSGEGVNLLSMANLLPDASFVGVDLSSVQSETARRLASLAGLRNVTFHTADLADAPIEPGSFDYVIAHGVYSWVPAGTRDALLATMAKALAPTGVAMLSYNVDPGQLAFEPVRRLMRFHDGTGADDGDRVARARAIAAAWCAAMKANDPHGRRGRHAQARRVERVLAATSAAVVRHDYLVPHERAHWFEEVVAHAARHGLAYLDNGTASGQRPELMDAETLAMLARLDDRVRVQQYLDHFEATRFRVTLFARADAPRTTPLATTGLHLESRLPDDSVVTSGNGIPRVAMETRDGVSEIDDLAVRAALGLLIEARPPVIALPALRDLTAARLARLGLVHEAARSSDEALLAHLDQWMRTLWRHDAIHYWRDPPQRAARRTGHPETGALQRVLAAHGGSVPSLYHRSGDPGDEVRALLGALDGSMDHARLAARFGPDTMEHLDRLRRERYLHEDEALTPPSSSLTPPSS